MSDEELRRMADRVSSTAVCNWIENTLRMEPRLFHPHTDACPGCGRRVSAPVCRFGDQRICLRCCVALSR